MLTITGSQARHRNGAPQPGSMPPAKAFVELSTLRFPLKTRPTFSFPLLKKAQASCHSPQQSLEQWIHADIGTNLSFNVGHQTESWATGQTLFVEDGLNLHRITPRIARRMVLEYHRSAARMQLRAPPLFL